MIWLQQWRKNNILKPFNNVAGNFVFLFPDLCVTNSEISFAGGKNVHDVHPLCGLQLSFGCMVKNCEAFEWK
jgi:hypothetical protein